MTLIDVFEKNATAIIALAGVLTGHLATVSLPFLQRHREKTEAVNRLRYWLLEMWWITDETYFIEYIKLTKKAFYELGIILPDAEINALIKQSMSSFFEELNNKKEESLRKANQGIETHLPSLMNHLPLLAFKISEFANPPDGTDYKKKATEYFDASLGNEEIKGISDIRNDISKILDDALPENELSESIKKGILNLSSAIGILQYYEMYRFFSRQKRSRTKDAKEAAEKVKSLMENLIEKNRLYAVSSGYLGNWSLPATRYAMVIRLS